MWNCCLKWYISQSGLSGNRTPPCYSLIASPLRCKCTSVLTLFYRMNGQLCGHEPASLTPLPFPPPQEAVKGGASEDLIRVEQHLQTPVVWLFRRRAELFDKGGWGNSLWRQLICHAWWNVWQIQVIYFTCQKDRKHLERYLMGKCLVLIKLPSMQHPRCCRYCSEARRTLAVGPTPLSSKGTDWSCHTLTGWIQLEIGAFYR